MKEPLVSEGFIVAAPDATRSSHLDHVKRFALHAQSDRVTGNVHLGGEQNCPGCLRVERPLKDLGIAFSSNDGKWRVWDIRVNAHPSPAPTTIAS